MKKTLNKLLASLLALSLLLTAVPATTAQAAVKKPAKVTITSVKRNSTYKKLTVKFKSVKKAKGYQVAYKTTTAKKWTYKTVSASKKSVTVAVKPTKNYKIKIRAYTKSGNKKLYGKWSVVKTSAKKTTKTNNTNPDSNNTDSDNDNDNTNQNPTTDSDTNTTCNHNWTAVYKTVVDKEAWDEATYTQQPKTVLMTRGYPQFDVENWTFDECSNWNTSHYTFYISIWYDMVCDYNICKAYGENLEITNDIEREYMLKHLNLTPNKTWFTKENTTAIIDEFVTMTNWNPYTWTGCGDTTCELCKKYPDYWNWTANTFSTDYIWDGVSTTDVFLGYVHHDAITHQEWDYDKCTLCGAINK